MSRITLTEEFIRKIDSENMLELLASFPKQCERAMFIGKALSIPDRYKKSYKNIIFLGLGGSAIGADIIRGYLFSECDIPISVIRDYEVPKYVGKDSLVFAASYSGNTEETLSMYAQAKSKKANIIVITSGGKLASLAEKSNNLLVTIPKGYPPRCALGYSFIPALIVLSKLGIIKNKINDIKEGVLLLNSMFKKELSPKVKDNVAKKIAYKIHEKFTVIYAASKHIDSVAVRWRGQLAENSKALASHHVYPEMNHNEIVGWDNPRFLLKKFVAINLKDREDHRRVKTRMDISKSILKNSGMNVIEVESRGKTLLSRILSLIYIGDFVSFYLSIIYGVDPTPVKRITYLKKQLSKRK